jgi:hypothetical protein
MPYLNVKEIKARADGKWDWLIQQLAPSLEPALKRPGVHVKCPVHGGVDGDGFRVFKDVVDTGGSCCNTCGIFPDGFSTIAFATGGTFHQVLSDVATKLGDPEAKVAPRRRPTVVAKARPTAEEDDATRAYLRSVFKSSRVLSSLEGEPVRLYLASRGLSLCPPTLRVHPGLFYKGKNGEGNEVRLGPFPTMLGLVVDPDERPVTLHRTYLAADGRKADVKEPKKLLSHPSDTELNGSAIRLFPLASTLAVAEGIENAIAVTEATGIPCWSTISAQFLEHFVPPRGVRRVLVFGDKDRPSKHHPEGHGQEAAKRLVQNLWARGIKASVALPPSQIPAGAKSVDWLDEFVRAGKTPFAAALAA